MDEYGSVEEASELEDEMLAAMAGSLAALMAGEPSWDDVNRSAASLRAGLNALANRREDAMAQAARGDVEGEGERNVREQQRTAGTDVKPNAMTAAKAAQGAHDDVSRVPQAMAADANRRYLSEAYRAAMEARAGKPRQQAVADAVRRLGEAGISCSTYTDGNGRTYRVPADVGVRRMVETRAMQMMGDQTLEIARACGQDLVEVSSHVGARPSHAEWQGRVYSLSGESERYPRFEEACNVGDMVRGIFGWNCRHHIAIYVEGTQRRWQRDPAREAGTTNAEAYAARSRQRRYENQIRRLKRASRALRSQGLDSRDVDARVSALQRALSAHVKAHPYLRRERWREDAAQAPLTISPRYALPDERAAGRLQRASDEAYSDMGTDQLSAMERYTTGDHNAVNPYLYGTYAPKSEAELQGIRRAVDEIDGAIGRFELAEDVVAVSGTKASHYADWREGQVRTIDGYLSTSVSKKVAEQFGKGGAGGFIITVRVPKGTRCLYIGDNTGFREPQHELLLMHGLSYRVVSKDESGMVLEVVK